MRQTTTGSPVTVSGQVYCLYCGSLLSRNDSGGYRISDCLCWRAVTARNAKAQGPTPTEGK